MLFNALWYGHNFGNFLLCDIDGEILEILVSHLVALYFYFIEVNFTSFFFLILASLRIFILRNPKNPGKSQTKLIKKLLKLLTFQRTLVWIELVKSYLWILTFCKINILNLKWRRAHPSGTTDELYRQNICLWLSVFTIILKSPKKENECFLRKNVYKWILK